MPHYESTILPRIRRNMRASLLAFGAALVLPLLLVASVQTLFPGNASDTVWVAVAVLAGLICAAALARNFFTHIEKVVLQLTVAERRWRQLMELSGDWYWEQDTEGRLVHIIRRGVTQTAQTAQTDGPEYLPFIGQKRWEVPGLRCLGTDWDSFQQTLIKAQPFTRLKFSYNTEDGRRVYFESTGKPNFNRLNEFTGYRGISSNITNRVLDANLLAAERQLLQGLLLSIPVGDLLPKWVFALQRTLSVQHEMLIWVKSPEGTHLDLLAKTNKQWALPDVWQTFDPSDTAHAHPLHALSQGYDVVSLLPHQLGAAVDALPCVGTGLPIASAWFCPVRGSDQNLLALFGIFQAAQGDPNERDVGRVQDASRALALGLERAVFENELQDLNTTLEARVADRTAALTETNRELEAFTYTVSHDLRAPLRAIDGFASILMEDYGEQVPEDAQGLLKRISGNARQMGGLIDGLLDFSRLLRADVTRVPIRMSEIVRSVCEQLDASNRATLEIGELPDTEGDPVLLQQVWMNLIDNALKFSARSTHPLVRIGSMPIGAKMEYFVQDNGAGFDMNYKDKLFNVFERLHHKKEFDGTGVGLAIVKRIIDRHGGEVYATGEPGQGARFAFRLPHGQ